MRWWPGRTPYSAVRALPAKGLVYQTVIGPGEVAPPGEELGLRVRALPAKWLLYQPVMVPWQMPPQVKDLRCRLRARATRTEKRWFLVSVSTPSSGWWKLMIRRGRMSRRNRIIARVSGSEPARGP